MNRRTYLASLTAFTTCGGCLNNAVNLDSSHQMEKTVSVSNVRRRPPAEPEKLDEDEKPTDLEFGVEAVDAKITSTTTARVMLTYTNGGENVLKLNINPERPDPQSSRAESPGLVLLSEAYDPTRRSDTCWKPQQEGFPRPAVGYQYPIEPGGSATLAYDVWATPGQDADCIRPADYQFEPLYGSFTLTVTSNESET